MRSVRRAERGSVTAEFALALPAVALVLTAGLGGVQIGLTQARAQDAAADAARLIARGDGEGAARERVRAAVPNASLAVSARGGMLCARVSAVPRGVAGLARVRISAESCALDGGR